MKELIFIIAMFLTAAQAFAATDPNVGEDQGSTAVCRNCLYSHQRAEAQLLNSESRENRADAILGEDEIPGPTNREQTGEVSEGA
ncbi:MAG: hypothetical protein AAF202_02255 [Pseudomonadota bacterium]